MANWYVDNAIVTSGDGLAWGTAWKNLADIVWASIQPGDTIYISGGTVEKIYSETFLLGASGTSGNQITITRGVEAGHSGVPTLDGTNTIERGIDSGWSDAPRNYVTVRNLAFRNFTAGGIVIADVTDFRIENCTVVSGSVGDFPRAIDIRSTTNSIVRNCDISTPSSAPGATDGIYSGDNTNYLYEGNRINILNTDDTGFSDAYQSHLDGGGTIRNNIFLAAPGVSVAGIAPNDFTTIAPANPLRTAIEAEALVGASVWEPRIANETANNTTPVGLGDISHGWSGYTQQALDELLARVDGNFTGTTDQIIQWAALKYGFEVDLIRAMCVYESNWLQSAEGDNVEASSGFCVIGDPRDPCPTSFGITQIKHYTNEGTYPFSADCTAFNLDYAVAKIRAVYEGWSYEGTQTTGDLWGAFGMHFSGEYVPSSYEAYVAALQNYYETKPWLAWPDESGELPGNPVNNRNIWIHSLLDGTTTNFYNNICVARGNQHNVTYWRESDVTGHGFFNIYNNTIVGGDRCINLERVGNVEIKNNVIVDGAIGVASNLIDPAPATIQNNLLFGQGTAVANTFASGNRTWIQWRLGNNNDGGVNSDPLFIDKEGMDFGVYAGSSVINGGTSLPVVTTDIRGVSRPVSTNMDMGVFEEVLPLVFAADSVPVPGGVSFATSDNIQDGDIIVVGIGTNSISGYSHVTPVGWTLLETSHNSVDGGSQFASVFTKSATSADADTTLFFEITPTGAKNSGVMAVYRGATLPIITASEVASHTGTATTTTLVPPISVAEIPAKLITLGTKKGGTGDGIPLTVPVGFIERAWGWVDGSGRMSIGLADKVTVDLGVNDIGPWNSIVSSGADTGFSIAMIEGEAPPLIAPIIRRWTGSEWYPPV